MAKTHQCSFYDKVDIDVLIYTYGKMQWPLYTKGDYNINLFGIRNTTNLHADTFNDLIGVLYKKNNVWQLFKADGTVDPGVQYRTNPMSSDGTFIIKHGYHKGAFKLGKHKGQYEALVQNKNIAGHRDNDKDAELDFVGDVSGHFGINLHRANLNSLAAKVGPHSAGCSAVHDAADFAALLSICKISKEAYGNSFSYAVFHESDFTWWK